MSRIEECPTCGAVVQDIDMTICDTCGFDCCPECMEADEGGVVCCNCNADEQSHPAPAFAPRPEDELE